MTATDEEVLTGAEVVVVIQELEPVNGNELRTVRCG